MLFNFVIDYTSFINMTLNRRYQYKYVAVVDYFSYLFISYKILFKKGLVIAYPKLNSGKSIKPIAFG